MSVATLRNREQGRRTADGPALALFGWPNLWFMYATGGVQWRPRGTSNAHGTDLDPINANSSSRDKPRSAYAPLGPVQLAGGRNQALTRPGQGPNSPNVG